MGSEGRLTEDSRLGRGVDDQGIASNLAEVSLMIETLKAKRREVLWQRQRLLELRQERMRIREDTEQRVREAHRRMRR